MEVLSSKCPLGTETLPPFYEMNLNKRRGIVFFPMPNPLREGGRGYSLWDYPVPNVN